MPDQLKTLKTAEITAEIIAKWINSRLEGVPVAGVSGANIEDLWISLSGTKSNLILTRHESGAVALVDGFSRCSGRPGVVLATSGGGALNVIPGLGEAFASRVPLIAMIGQPPLSSIGSGAFQETSGLNGTFSMSELLSKCTKKVQTLNAGASIIETLDDLHCEATAHPQGPVVLLIPKDEFERTQSVLMDQATQKSLAKQKFDSIGNVLKRIRSHRGIKLGIVLGGGIARELGREFTNAELRALLESKDVQWATTVESKTLGDFNDAGYVGMVGVIGNESAFQAIGSCDLQIVIGTRLGGVDRMGLDGVLDTHKSILIHTEKPFEVKRWVEIENQYQVESLYSELKTILELIPKRKKTKQLKADSKFIELSKALSIHDLGSIFGPMIQKREMNVIVDAGNAVTAFTLDSPRPKGNGQFLIAMGMGGMGYSLGAGLGAYYANLLPTLIFAGDGAYAMSGSEFQVAIERKLPVLLVIADNGGHAMCSTREKLYFGHKTDVNSFSIGKLTDGLRAQYPGLSVSAARTGKELKRALGNLEDFSEPSVLVLDLKHDEVPPFIPFQRIIQKQDQEKL